MQTPFYEFVMSAGPVIGSCLIGALFLTLCVIAALALRNSIAGRTIDITVLGFLKVKVDDSKVQRPELPQGKTGISAGPTGGTQSGRQDQPPNPAP